MSEIAKYLISSGLVLSFTCYTIFIYRQPTAQKFTTNSGIVMQGKMIWQEKNCTACHQIYGLGGFLGPDLTNIYSAKGKGPAYIRAFVTAGTPTMPSFQLSEEELIALMGYLRHVDSSGKADPKEFKVNYDGTIEGQ